MFDLRWLLPPTLGPDSTFTMPASAPGESPPTFTTPVPGGTPRVPEMLTERPPGVFPDERSVQTSRKVPEVVGLPGSPTDERLVPTPASTAPPPQTIGNYWDRIMALQKEGKLAPVIAALAKGIGAGAADAPKIPQTHMPQLAPIRGEPHRQDANAAAMMEKLMAASPGKAKKSQRRMEQDRYDILGGRG
jgi:hypothetical protein